MALESSSEERIHSDEEAFGQIVRCYGRTLARYVCHRIVNPSDAEDVLQEILVGVWLGFKNLRDPERTYGWLMQIAQNRCRDYFRVQKRKEMPLEEETLLTYASRFGLHQYRQTQTMTDVIEALETAPLAAREAARRFYLQGLSIAEIAAETHSPPGTVKRQLFQARHAARAFLGIARPAPISHTEKQIMTTQTVQPRQHIAEDAPRFPLIRPEIRITELDEPPFTVDCRELRSWSIIPVVGEQAAYADYALPEWKLIEVSSMQALRAAQIHDVDGVEINVQGWKPEAGWQRPGTVYGRLTDDKAEYLAVQLPDRETTQFETFLDEWFAGNWGTLDRTISDHGIVKRQSEGSFLLSAEIPRHRGMGISAGLVRLQIGSKSLTCLRVLELPEEAALPTSEQYYITESYLTQEGRTVLVRRFCRPGFANVAEFPLILDASEQMVINGVTFVHWYDSIMEIALH